MIYSLLGVLTLLGLVVMIVVRIFRHADANFMYHNKKSSETLANPWMFGIVGLFLAIISYWLWPVAWGYLLYKHGKDLVSSFKQTIGDLFK